MKRGAIAWLVPIAAVVAVAAIPFVLGVPKGNDWSFELVRIVEKRAAFASGQFPPFWAPDEYRGFGSPIFLYYGPLFGWIAAPTSMRIAVALFVVVAAVMMGAATRSRLAVVAFVLHPYFLGDIWMRNANAEVAAVALLPGVIAGAIAEDARRRFWWTALPLAAVILAHNITALVAVTLSIGIALYVHRSWRGVAPVLAGIVVAFALTAFFWVPTLALKSIGVRDEALTTGQFDFHNRFPRAVALLTIDPPREYFSGGALGVVMLVIVLGAAVMRRNRIVEACAIAAIVLFVLMLRISVPVWEHVPLMRYLQFPWRLAGPLSVVTIIGFAAAIPLRRGVEPAVILLAVLTVIPMFAAYRPVPEEEWRFFTHMLTPDGVRTYGLRSTVADDYLPAGADRRVIASNALSDSTHVAVNSPNGGTIGFRRWYFPVWRATIDGVAAPVVAGSGGVAAVHVPPGRHDVELRLVEPRVRTIAKIFSAIAALLLGVATAYDRSRKASPSRTPRTL